MRDLDRMATVAQIVTGHPAAARVFQSHGIDYCCHGDVSLSQSCREEGLDLEAVLSELSSELARGDRGPEEDPRSLSTAALVARIVDRHHGYLRRALPQIAPIMAKVAGVHGRRNPDLLRIAEAVRALTASLLPHLEEEEEVLFPLLTARVPGRDELTRELVRMRADHLEVGKLLAEIRALTSGFSTPEWGCNTYRVLMAELDELEADILRHVHLENHVLAPRFEARAAPAGMQAGGAQPRTGALPEGQ